MVAELDLLDLLDPSVLCCSGGVLIRVGTRSNLEKRRFKGENFTGALGFVEEFRYASRQFKKCDICQYNEPESRHW